MNVRMALDPFDVEPVVGRLIGTHLDGIDPREQDDLVRSGERHKAPGPVGPGAVGPLARWRVLLFFALIKTNQRATRTDVLGPWHRRRGRILCQAPSVPDDRTRPIRLADAVRRPRDEIDRAIQGT